MMTGFLLQHCLAISSFLMGVGVKSKNQPRNWQIFPYLSSISVRAFAYKNDNNTPYPTSMKLPIIEMSIHIYFSWSLCTLAIYLSLISDSIILTTSTSTITLSLTTFPPWITWGWSIDHWCRRETKPRQFQVHHIPVRLQCFPWNCFVKIPGFPWFTQM